MILAFDTETTGFPDFKAPSIALHQPHLVQLGFVLLDEDGAEHEVCDVLVRPDGWTIPAKATAIHGISQERALAEGIPLVDVVRRYTAALLRSKARVAHNRAFDDRIMRIAMCRAGMAREAIEQLESRPGFCTMALSHPIVRVPPTERMRAAGRTGSKVPNLGECVRHFFGEVLEGAHDGLVDARACGRVFHRLRQLDVALA